MARPPNMAHRLAAPPARAPRKTVPKRSPAKRAVKAAHAKTTNRPANLPGLPQPSAGGGHVPPPAEATSFFTGPGGNTLSLGEGNKLFLFGREYLGSVFDQRGYMVFQAVEAPRHPPILLTTTSIPGATPSHPDCQDQNPSQGTLTQWLTAHELGTYAAVLAAEHITTKQYVRNLVTLKEYEEDFKRLVPSFGARIRLTRLVEIGDGNNSASNEGAPAMKKLRSEISATDANLKLVSCDEYTSFLEANPTILKEFKFSSQLPNPPAGLSAFAERIESEVPILRKGLKGPDATQATMALVLKSSSGVGKTFGSVAVAGIINRKNTEDYYLPIYTGFSSVFTINGGEEAFLKDIAIPANERIEAFIGRRLLLQLMFITKQLEKNSQMLWEVVESNGRHLTPAPPTTDSAFEAHLVFPYGYELRDECARLINQLSQRCGGRKLVVLLIIDNGQQLDGCIPPIDFSDYGGARLALGFGRELQYSCSTDDALLLPIITGIDPQISLTHQTTGRNKVFDDPLHTLAEFVDIALTMDKDRDSESKQLRARWLAALFYPSARDLKFVYENDSSAIKKHIASYSIPREKAQLLLMASGTVTKQDVSIWSPAVPAIISGNTFTPVPSFYHVSEYLLHCSWVPLGCIFDESACIALYFQTSAKFQTVAFDIVCALLTLTNMPGSPHEDIAYDYTLMRQAWLDRNPWFNLQVDILQEPTQTESYCQSDSVSLPSSVHIGHSEAFSVTNGHAKHPLFAGIKDSLLILKKQGELFSINCGGSAPVDFIHVVLKTSRTGDAGPCDVQLLVAKTKHFSKEPEKRRELSIRTAEVLRKFSVVTPYLKAALLDDCQMTVTEVKCAIITNLAMEQTVVTGITDGYLKAAVKDAETSALSASDLTNKINVVRSFIPMTYILSPATLSFPPLTTRLFDVPLKKKKE